LDSLELRSASSREAKEKDGHPSSGISYSPARELNENRQPVGEHNGALRLEVIELMKAETIVVKPHVVVLLCNARSHGFVLGIDP
jgi:hypothetical protein